MYCIVCIILEPIGACSLQCTQHMIVIGLQTESKCLYARTL